MQKRCTASTTTPTPRGASASVSALGNLLGEPFLHLKSAGVHVMMRGILERPTIVERPTIFPRDVRHVRPAEGQQMVLAERVEIDVAHQDHRLVRPLEDRIADRLGGSQSIPARETGECVRDALRSSEETLTLGRFTEQLEHAPDELLEFLVVRRRGVQVEPEGDARLVDTGWVDGWPRGQRERLGNREVSRL